MTPLTHIPAPTGETRTLIVSQRSFSRGLARACPYTFEDLIQRVDPAERLDLEVIDRPQPRFESLRQSIQRRLNLEIKRGDRRKKYKLDRDYDLIFFHCQSAGDLQYISQITNWRERCTKAVIWLDDIWPSDIEKYDSLLRPIEGFDHCFVGLADSARAISAKLKCPTTFLPPGVDVNLFSPTRLSMPRAIDFFWMGRRVEPSHSAIRRLADERRKVYLYDTASSTVFLDHVEHRRMTARLINSSKYFIVNRSRVDDDGGRIGKFEGFGFRYFEGAAGGAVMLGGAPQTPEFNEAFDWPDAVLPLDGSYEQLVDTIEMLESDPERVRHIRENNVAGCLRKHDWSQRWQTILETIGLEPDQALLAWQNQLQEESRRVLDKGL